MLQKQPLGDALENPYSQNREKQLKNAWVDLLVKLQDVSGEWVYHKTLFLGKSILGNTLSCVF